MIAQNSSGSVATTLGGNSVLQQALVAGAGKEPFQLTPLPYAYDALEPIIDRDSLIWHHDVYHRHFVDCLNSALVESKRAVSGQSLDSILSRISEYSATVRVNAGGHWNHAFLWSAMTDNLEDHEMPPRVLHALEKSFGSLENFKTEFVRAGAQHAGAGWLWLMQRPDGKLELQTTNGNDSPVMDVLGGVEANGIPLLVCDLWDHEKQLTFKLKREEFLRKFLAIANWACVEQRLAKTDLKPALQEDEKH